jgi:hypothetical protein
VKEFTRALHLSPSWGRRIQSTPPHRTSARSILILSNHLRLGLPSGLFPTNNLYAFLFSPFVLHAPPTSSSPNLHNCTKLLWRSKGSVTWQRTSGEYLTGSSPCQSNCKEMGSEITPSNLQQRVNEYRGASKFSKCNFWKGRREI